MTKDENAYLCSFQFSDQLVHLLLKDINSAFPRYQVSVSTRFNEPLARTGSNADLRLLGRGLSGKTQEWQSLVHRSQLRAS